MICFKGRTFCTDKECTKFDRCEKALTKDMSKQADKWWGKDGAPVAVYTVRLECFEAKKEN